MLVERTKLVFLNAEPAIEAMLVIDMATLSLGRGTFDIGVSQDDAIVAGGVGV